MVLNRKYCQTVLLAGALTTFSPLPLAFSAPTDSGNAAVASHQRMLEALAAIAETTDDTNTYVGDQRARRSRFVYSLLTPNMPAFERWNSTLTLGLEEMNLGNLNEAIPLLEAAWELCSSEGLQTQWKTRSLSILAIAYFRLGETENCCSKPSPESCVYPLKGSAIHGREEGSRKAITTLHKLLELPGQQHNQMTAIWLLNLAYMTLGEHPNGVPEAYRL
ncbi:MAG: hypothetical protein ACI97B_004728, partial [Verrucomicrobiales bacterium]